MRLIRKIFTLKNAKFLLKMRCYFYFNNYRSFIYPGFSLFGYSKNVAIGKDVRFYPRCIVEVQSSSKLFIGNGCVFSYGVLIACHKNLIIGENVLVGEYSSIRDTSHQYLAGKIVKDNVDISDEIVIGDNVWIGRGCIVLPGTVIESNTVFASNSVIKGYYPCSAVYGGNRAKFIKPIC